MIRSNFMNDSIMNKNDHIHLLFVGKATKTQSHGYLILIIFFHYLLSHPL